MQGDVEAYGIDFFGGFGSGDDHREDSGNGSTHYRYRFDRLHDGDGSGCGYGYGDGDGFGFGYGDDYGHESRGSDWFG